MNDTVIVNRNDLWAVLAMAEYGWSEIHEGTGSFEEKYLRKAMDVLTLTATTANL